MQSLIKGRLSDEEADAILPALRAERDRIKGALAACHDAPSLITLHPATMSTSRAAVDRPAQTRTTHARAEDDRGQLVRDFRAGACVVVTPTDDRRELLLELRGRFAALMTGDVFPE